MFSDMFGRILQFIRGVLNKMLTQSNAKQALGVDVRVSIFMTEALRLWSLMYVNRAPWLKDGIISLNLPATISGELARIATVEMQVKIEGSARADYLQAQIDKIMPVVRQKLELCLAKGGMIFKPIPDEDGIPIDFVQADAFLPVSFDSSGNITACVFSSTKQMGDKYYTHMEYHALEDQHTFTVYRDSNGVQINTFTPAQMQSMASGNMPDGAVKKEPVTVDGDFYVIRNVAFKSYSQNDLGTVCPLSEVDEWADLQTEQVFKDIVKPLYGYCKPPFANNIDPTSALGVSCYARAVNLIEQADKIWANLIWEFESGQRAINVDATLFTVDKKTGLPYVPDRRLYKTFNSAGDIGADKPLFSEWSPEFREAAIKAGLNDVFRQIELNCGLSFGIISDPMVEAKTATEVVSGKQRLYSTVVDVQRALEDAMRQMVYAMDAWASLAGLAPEGDYAITFDFDDSVIADRNAQFVQDTQTKGLSLMPGYVFLMRNYGMSEKDAKKWVEEANAEKPSGFSFAQPKQPVASGMTQ